MPKLTEPAPETKQLPTRAAYYRPTRARELRRLIPWLECIWHLLGSAAAVTFLVQCICIVSGVFPEGRALFVFAGAAVLAAISGVVAVDVRRTTEAYRAEAAHLERGHAARFGNLPEPEEPLRQPEAGDEGAGQAEEEGESERHRRHRSSRGSSHRDRC